MKLFSPTSMSFMYIYEQDWSEKRALWNATRDWCPIRGSAIDDYPLFSITQPVFYPVVDFSIHSKLFDLEH